MALAPGVRLGPYEIAAEIGVGGMGEVYRARDTKLDRQVVIKVLPEAFAADRECLAAESAKRPGRMMAKALSVALVALSLASATACAASW